MREDGDRRNGVAGKRCPECGAVMDRLDPVQHAFSHWGDKDLLPTTSREAIARYDLVVNGGVSEAEYRKIHPEAE